ncbi:longitudinals lacking protein, isoforms A/B/D/L-like isoform X1 [Melanaphis sacchari]|uniref:longitudinals lacking protein, isoforms A/B/D/L-like isoform X1 n=1 Tax=Melanaphis sacchari TaxID=742174 RepID=UPI000DC12E83|nr:longitudinals lacking protein, isoforms A/B/D/L-like isoform X1 [Melanaphis sacchari]
MSVSQQFCLRWNNHQRTLISVFDSLLESGTLVDCTLAAEGRYLKAHKVVLSACSPYLGVLLSQHQEKHPILILKDIKFQELKSMLDYMYRGEVNISQEELGTFLKAAESLQIKGLTESAGIGVRDNSDFEDPVSKRFDHRKQPPSLSSVSSNSPTIWSQNETVRTYSRPREGSLSPTSKKRKLQRTNGSDDHHQDNGDDSLTESEPQGVEKSPTNNNNIPSSVSKVIKAEPYRKSCSPDKEVSKTTENQIIKPKVESISGDRQECLTEMSYDDSVEDMALEEEEEEFDENELSQPGTSQGDTNHTAVPQTNSWQLDTTNQDSTSTVNTPMDCKEIIKRWQDGGENWDGYPPTQRSLVPLFNSFGPNGPMSAINFKFTNYYNNCKFDPTSPNDTLQISNANSPSTSGGVECPRCGRHYKLKSSLRNHQKWECGKDPQFQCPFCNYRAKQKMHVARHIERMHREKCSEEFQNITGQTTTAATTATAVGDINS